MTIEQIVKALADRNLMAVSTATGIGYQTVRNIARGITKDPHYSVYKALNDYLKGGASNE